MNRRAFLARLAAGATAAAAMSFLDPERLLWVPGSKTFFIPETVGIRPATLIQEATEADLHRAIHGPGRYTLELNESTFLSDLRAAGPAAFATLAGTVIVHRKDGRSIHLTGSDFAAHSERLKQTLLVLEAKARA